MSGATPIDWTPEHVQRFWDYWAQREDAQDSYFAKQNGAAVIAFLEHAEPLQDREVLDYGAGPGYLVEQLLQRGARVSAVDYSPASVERLNARFGDHPSWRQARLFEDHRLPWSGENFDLVCCLETIEHVLEQHADLVFHELHRVLRSGGLALFTTPHNEDLARSDVYCPHCGSEFHRWQHVRKWTSGQLEEQLAAQGFEVVFCRGINLQRFDPAAGGSWRQLCFASLERWAKQRAYQLWDRLAPGPFPHGRAFQVQCRGRHCPNLVAVVRKPRGTAAAQIEPRRRQALATKAA